MKYRYEDIDTLSDMRDIVIKEINNRADNKQFIQMATSYLGEIMEELDDPNENVAKCNELIDEVVDWLNDTENDMKCPMCEEYNIKHEEYKGSHIYICQSCPFVGFELIETKDKENMIEWLKENR